MNVLEIIECILVGIFLVGSSAFIWGVTYITKRNYIFCFHVQFDEDSNPCICGTSVKELCQLTIRGRSLKKAEVEAFRRMELKYPAYKGLLQYT